MSGERKTRDRIPTLQDFMDEDFKIKQIDNKISSAISKFNKVEQELKKINELKKKYSKKTTKKNAKEYFFALYTGMGMEEDDFEATLKDEGGNTIPGMYKYLNKQKEKKEKKKKRERLTFKNYIEALKKKKVNIIKSDERTSSQAAQKGAEDAITTEAIKAVEKFDKQLSKFQNKMSLDEKYNRQVDATLHMWSIGKDKKEITKSILNKEINKLYDSVIKGEFNFQPRRERHGICWDKIKQEVGKSPLNLSLKDYPDIIIPLIYKTLIFIIPFTRYAISLKTQAQIRINQLPEVIESETAEYIKNLKLSFDYLKAELQSLNSNLEIFNAKQFLECIVTKQDILSIPRSLPSILHLIISNFPVETNIEHVWLEITTLDERVKEMEKIRREMDQYYNRKSPDDIMREDTEKDFDSWRPGSGVKPLSPEEIRQRQRGMYRDAGKPIPKWLKKKGNARTRANKAVDTATRRLNSLFGREEKTQGGRRKKTRKKRRKAKRSRKRRK